MDVGDPIFRPFREMAKSVIRFIEWVNKFPFREINFQRYFPLHFMNWHRDITQLYVLTLIFTKLIFSITGHRNCNTQRHYFINRYNIESEIRSWNWYYKILCSSTVFFLSQTIWKNILSSFWTRIIGPYLFGHNEYTSERLFVFRTFYNFGESFEHSVCVYFSSIKCINSVNKYCTMKKVERINFPPCVTAIQYAYLLLVLMLKLFVFQYEYFLCFFGKRVLF